jgi:putative copper resistance protein D
MRPIQGLDHPRVYNFRVLALLPICLAFMLVPFVRSQQNAMDSMAGMNMETSVVQDEPAVAAKRLADKQESEFNHHFAGFLVILAGLFILVEDKIGRRWPPLRYGWPACFFVAGIFLLIFSDTEIWPFGPQSPWYAITHSREDLQHKTFAVILLVLGYVALQRARGRWKALWAAWFFPVVGAAGAILLLFHVHSGDMHAPHAMATMEHIQKQHRSFAAVGFGVALANGLAETPQKWQRFFRAAWAVMLIALGLLLVQYTE